jgi:hypothetical protein
MNDEEAIELWTRKIFARSDVIDPAGERDWVDMAYGFLMGLGFEPEKAEALVERMITFRVV